MKSIVFIYLGRRNLGVEGPSTLLYFTLLERKAKAKAKAKAKGERKEGCLFFTFIFPVFL